VRLDDSLRWSEHIDKLAAILTSNVFVIRNLAVYNNLNLCKLVYYSLLESYIRYSIVLWGLSSKLNLNRIFIIQKKAIRSICRLKPSESCREKFRELQILTVPSLYIFETIMYVKENNLIQAHHHSHFTRNRNVNPSIQHNLKLFESKPSYTGVKYFSQLPSMIKDTVKINSFKKKLKLHLIEKCYYELPELH
jgi:hypothetical protein